MDEIAADIQGVQAANRIEACEGWLPVKQRTVCAEKVAPLKAELARAARRQVLEAELSELVAGARNSTDAARGQQTKADADPGATALATYLAALGLAVPVNVLSQWLVLVPVFALEIGSAFAGLLVAGSSGTLRSAPRQKCSVAPPSNTQQTPIQSTPEPGVQGVQDSASKLAVADDPAERLLQLLRDRGGEVFGGQRTLGKALGVSAARVNTLLDELAASGRIVVAAAKNGTRVRLAA
jgi:hypothetical protein